MLARIDQTIRDAMLLTDPAVALGYREPRRWQILLAAPAKEREAMDWLKRAGLSCYWPNYIKQIRVGPGSGPGRARRSVHCAVIPGYLFMAVRVGATCDPWAVIHETPGLHGYLRDGSGRPAAMADEDIEIIRRIEGGLNVPPAAKHGHHRFKVGEKVRFADDLMGRWPVGTASSLDPDGRIVVDVELLGRVVPVRVFPFQIEAM